MFTPYQANIISPGALLGMLCFGLWTCVCRRQLRQLLRIQSEQMFLGKRWMLLAHPLDTFHDNAKNDSCFCTNKIENKEQATGYLVISCCMYGLQIFANILLGVNLDI